MTTRVGFYHLTTSTLEIALPRLLEKALRSGLRSLLMTGSVQRAEYLDALLWTYEADSWLPHGVAGSGDTALQPILLTASEDNLNGAELLVLIDGVNPPNITNYPRCINLFDGKDPEAVEVARGHWRVWAAAGHALTYYQQNERGAWEEKATANASA